MRFLLFACLVLVTACSVYDPNLIKPLDGNVAGSGGGTEAGVDADDDDAGGGNCRVIPDAPCPLVCLETCNGLDEDCDGIADNNGAERSCDLPGGVSACDDGVCRLVSCDDQHADCNGREDDGCEADLGSADHCGLCGAACVFPNTVPTCVQGTCVKGDCLPGFGDCDGQPSNGCETNVMTLERCGSCTGRCPAQPNALPECDTGVCAIAECVGNFGNCDGLVENGCETPLDEPENCGMCGATCEGLPNATATCGESGCEGLICLGEYKDCDGRADTGCEALLDEPDNCGMCGMVCDLPNVAIHLCEVSGSAGTCRIDDTAENGGCDAGFADCNTTDADGCETALNTTTDCGACNSTCTFSNGVGTCETGTCRLVGCSPGSDDCNDDGVCESLAEDPDNCGACGTVCGSTTPVCSAGRCRVGACPGGTADCDSNDTDCETDITQAATCGGCNNNCTGRPNTTGGTCSNGTCQITCATGFANCNGDIADGCETNTRTLSNCGSCGTTCAIANATATCATGSCRVDMCADTHRDCDMNATSCETNITLPASCGSCTTDCTGRANTTGAGCNMGACEVTCSPGFRNCDGMVGNGCEVNITTPTNCGGCGTNCGALANVGTTSCTSGSCAISTCASGYANCDGLPSNGCEKPTNTNTDCGGCNVACSFPNAAASCSTGTCTKGACNTGFDDCNMNPADGCETQLNTTSNCGVCGRTCAMGETCTNGSCVAMPTCPSGQNLCGGTACVRVDGNCSLWPCAIDRPGPDTNCGGCGKTCALFGCCLGI